MTAVKSKYRLALLIAEANCRKHHADQTQTLEQALDLAGRLFHGMARAGPEEYKADPRLQAVHMLFMRSLELMRNSYWAILTGSYGTSNALSRLVLENSELSLLLIKDPSAIEKWMNGEHFPPREVRQALYKGAELEETAKFYGRLSDYVHPNAIGWPEYLKVSTDAQTYGLPLYPVYDTKATSDSLSVLAYSIRVAFLSVGGPFRPWLTRLSKDLESSTRELQAL